MARQSLRPQLNQIRAWVRQGRTDAWIAHQLGVPASQLRDFRHRHGLTSEGEEPASEDSRPAYLELEHLAEELPPAERAAVVLRYGYDLPYSGIGAALGSSADAARQAASSGIRRLRRKEGLA